MAPIAPDCSESANLAFHQDCENCALADICLPVGLSQDEMHQLDKAVTKQYVVKRGEKLFKENEPFTALYAVRSGSVKTYHNAFMDREQITGFYLGGELLGFSGIAATKYKVTAEALEASSVCVLLFDRLLVLAAKIPQLQKHLMALLSQKQENKIPINSSASERLSLFLLSLSAKYKRRHYAADHFTLSMSRQDIANFLGLATETMSRLFSRFQQDGIIEVDHRDILIKDFRALQTIACGAPHGPS